MKSTLFSILSLEEMNRISGGGQLSGVLLDDQAAKKGMLTGHLADDQPVRSIRVS